MLDNKDKVINAFLGWCSLFLQTGNGQVLYLGYNKSEASKEKYIEKNGIVVCSEVPKYIVNIECGAKETFLITIDLDLYKWWEIYFKFTRTTLIHFSYRAGFNFAKTFPTPVSLNALNSVINAENGNFSQF